MDQLSTVVLLAAVAGMLLGKPKTKKLQNAVKWGLGGAGAVALANRFGVKIPVPRLSA